MSKYYIMTTDENKVVAVEVTNVGKIDSFLAKRLFQEKPDWTIHHETFTSFDDILSKHNWLENNPKTERYFEYIRESEKLLRDVKDRVVDFASLSFVVDNKTNKILEPEIKIGIFSLTNYIIELIGNFNLDIMIEIISQKEFDGLVDKGHDVIKC